MVFNRTENFKRNVFYGMLNRIISILFPFIIRTMIIIYLGEEYLGINSLFTSILQVLNLAELGFSAAIVVFMYKPIAENDTLKVNALLNLYRKMYRIIGITILVTGICVTPFLKYLISGTYPDDINIYVLFLLYLLNTAISYLLFSYKKSILHAHQRMDLTEKVGGSVRLFISIVQIALLYFTKNITVYVITNVICTLLDNIICSFIVNKKFSEYKGEGKLDKETRKEIFQNVRALTIHKVGNTVSISLDTVVISAFLGLTTVAIYGNYYYIISAITVFLTLIYGSITASVGNSIVIESKDKNYQDFTKFFFLNTWLIGWCAICLLCLLQPFMIIWMGKPLTFEIHIIILLVLQFYITLIRKVVLTYKDAAGIWRADKYKPLVGCIANLILNLYLVRMIGIEGVIISTIISYFFIELPWETHVLFKEYFQRKELQYYFQMAKTTLSFFVISLLTFITCAQLPMNGVGWFILKIIICIFLPNFLFVIIYRRTNQYAQASLILYRLFNLRFRKVLQ
jgi:O-antigen/teichoic acid export membrane protein